MGNRQVKIVRHTNGPCLCYGIKAYGTWDCFSSRREYEKFLMDWIAGSEGSERNRAVDALVNLQSGINFTDTDAGKRFSSIDR